MIFSLLRKVLSNRYISIAAASISTTACFPLVVNAVPVTTEYYPTVTFNLGRCVSRGNDIICGGILHNSSGEQEVQIARTRLWTVGDNTTSITDSNGTTYVASKILVGNSAVCDESCGYIEGLKLVQGVNYKTIFVFSNVSLPSNSIALLDIRGLGFKARNINISSPNSQNNRPRPIVSNNSGGQGRYQSSLFAYRTGNDRVIISGLVARQQYSVNAISFGGKRAGKLLMANACGEIIITGTARISSLAVGTEPINMTDLPTRNRARCGG